MDRVVKEVAGDETRTSLTGGVAATVIDKTKLLVTLDDCVNFMPAAARKALLT